MFNLNFHSTFFQLQPNKNLTSFRTSTESVVYKNLTTVRTEIEFNISAKKYEIIHLPTKSESDLELALFTIGSQCGVGSRHKSVR